MPRYFPGEPFTPLLGNFVAFMRHLDQRHHWFRQLSAKYGPVVQVNRFRNVMLVLSDPADIRTMFRQVPDRPALRGFAAFAPTGLLALPYGDQWHQHHKLIAPLMADRFMRSYAQKMAAAAHELCDVLSLFAGTPLHVYRYVSAMGLDVIGSCAYGASFGAVAALRDLPPNPPIGDNSMLGAARTILNEVVRMLFVPPFLSQLWNRGLVEKVSKPFRDACAALIDAHAARNASESQKTTIMNALLQAYENGAISMQDVESEAATTLLAGYETSSNTISWALFHLAQNPSVADKLRKQIQAVLDAKQQRPDDDVVGLTFDDMKKLRFARHIVHETLRMSPVVAGASRKLDSPITLRGKVIPAGVVLTVNNHTNNMNSDIWGDDCNVFRPERHAEREQRGGHPFEFTPFGGGQRVCIGRRFALLEVELVICILAQQFNFKFDDQCTQPIEQMSVTMGCGPFSLKFERR